MRVLQLTFLCAFCVWQLIAHETVVDVDKENKKTYLTADVATGFLRSQQVSSTPTSAPSISHRPTRFPKRSHKPRRSHAPHPSESPSESSEESADEIESKARVLSGCDEMDSITDEDFEVAGEGEVEQYDPTLDELNDVLILTEKDGELFLQSEEDIDMQDMTPEEETLSPSIVATLPPSLQMSIPPFSMPPFSLPPFSMPPFSLPPFNFPPFSMKSMLPTNEPKSHPPHHSHPPLPPHSHSLPPFTPPKPKPSPESPPPFPQPPTATE